MSTATAKVFSQDQQSALDLAVHISSSLSCLGAAAIIFCFSFVDRFRTANNRMVLWMAVADFFAAIHLFFGIWPVTIFENAAFCTYQGYAVQFFLFSAMLWTTCMLLQCLLAILKKSSLESLGYMDKWYHVISWGIPALIATAIACYGQFVAKENIMGSATILCWINDRFQQFRMYFFYIPLWTVFFVNLGIYIYLGYTVLRSQRTIANQTQIRLINNPLIRRYVFKMTLFFFAFIFNWSWGTANRIQNIIAPGKPIFALFMCHAIFTPLQGFINSMIYFWMAIYMKTKDAKKRETQRLTMMQTTSQYSDASIRGDSPDFKPLFTNTMMQGMMHKPLVHPSLPVMEQTDNISLKQSLKSVKQSPQLKNVESSESTVGDTSQQAIIIDHNLSGSLPRSLMGTLSNASHRRQSYSDLEDGDSTRDSVVLNENISSSLMSMVERVPTESYTVRDSMASSNL